MQYTDILPNWMNYEALYDKAVAEAKTGDRFIELGTFLGRSAVYMAQKIKDSGKDIRFTSIDLFDAENNDHGHKITPFMEAAAKQNVIKCGVNMYVDIFKSDTTEWAKKHTGTDIYNFIFIDAAHTYQGVKADITNYLPLLKSGGTMAGHDYNLQAVKQAVDEMFTFNQLKFYQNCWIYKKPVMHE